MHFTGSLSSGVCRHSDTGWDVLDEMFCSCVHFPFLCFCFHQFPTVLLSSYVAAAVQVSYLRCSYPAAMITKSMLMVSIVQDRVNIVHVCTHTHTQRHTQRALPSKKTSSLLSVPTRKWKVGQLSMIRFGLFFYIYIKAKRSILQIHVNQSKLFSLGFRIHLQLETTNLKPHSHALKQPC